MTRKQRQYNGEKIVSSTNSIGKTKQPHAKKEEKKKEKNASIYRPYTSYKNYIKMNLMSVYKTQKYKSPGRWHRRKLDDLEYGDTF